MAQGDHFEHQVGAASGFAKSDRARFSGYRHVRSLSPGLRNHQSIPVDQVLRTHNSGLHHLILGSVAERVVRLAKCPVLTVRAAAEPAKRVRARRGAAKAVKG